MTEKLSLSELQLIIRDALYMALPDMYWIIAEISEIKENYAGHCYLELIEKHPDEKNARARVKAIIWSKRYIFLKSFFENITGEELKEGMKILVRIKIEYHELYGLSLIISDIDPSFTIGEMALKRQMVIKKLEDEGVFTMNKGLPFPVIPQRIAVISSKSAAGYSDFTNQLTTNNNGYVFYTALFETTMQGKETEQSVINSLDHIAGHMEMFDVVAVIRGGGSQSDLSWFDSYNIAYHITQFPLPVITGIGHEKDLSVTDMVAFRSLKTPTAVADHLIDCITETETRMEEMVNEIIDASRMIVEANRSLLDTFRMKLIPVARLMVSNQKEELSNRIIEMINFGRELIAEAGLIPATQKSKLISASGYFSTGKSILVENKKNELISKTIGHINKMHDRNDGLANRLKIMDPEGVLRRGYTITSMNGKIIKSAKHIDIDSLIDTKFSDGKIKSKVIEKKQDRKNKKQE